MTEDKWMRLDYRKTFLIGFGFFASSLAWSIYNSFVPLMLEERYIANTALIGFIMTIDNIFGVIFQPLVGQISDRTHTRIGRRMPYILIGIPICALAFIFIPLTRSLAAMMFVIILFNLVMSTWRSPVVALMPDLTPSALRSKANGVINLMGGVGSIIAFLIGGWLAKIAGYNLPFLMGAVVMIFAVLMLFFFVREPDSRKLARQLDEAEAGLNQEIRQKPAAESPSEPAAAGPAASDDGGPKISHLSRPEKRSLFALLLAIFFWFAGYNAVETFFTLYAKNHLGVEKGDATMSLTLFSLTLVAFALPAGVLAGRFGRKKLILIGLVGIILTFLPIIFVESLLVLRMLLFVGGFFWACININSLPMVVELAAKERIGSFTGYYYFFSFSAAIISPTFYGWIRDLTQDYSTLFIYAVAAFALALASMLLVHHGEAAKG
jgi:maltose/moltooligosaccharide transporter